VRELQNVVERAMIVSPGGKLTLDLPQTGKTSAKQKEQATQPAVVLPEIVIPENEWRNRERANVIAALRQAHFKISGKGGAADLLGINPGTLASRLKALRINKQDYVK
jgi:transcriptional regulator with GAF, ATPase, and Fis domain